MSLIVQKFGGSSVKNDECLMNVARIVTETYQQGHDVIVVVSAQGDTTDELIEKAQRLNIRASKREMDALISTGEQISASLLAMAIEKLGFPAISLTGWQAGFVSDTRHGSARIKKIETERLHNEIHKKNIVIVTGFQGINRYDDITTLGRGGSDTSAVAIAAAMQADVCQIYTDVDGVYTADPRKVKGAKKLTEITYDEMLELATLGAQVLHNRSVQLAKKYNIKMEVLSSLENKPGTQVKEVTEMESMLVRGVTCDKNIARIALVSLPDEPGVAFKVFSALAAKNISVDVIIQSLSKEGRNDISFSVDDKNLDLARYILEEMQPAIGFAEIKHDSEIAKVSIVGSGMQTNAGVAAKMFEALSNAKINIEMIATSEIKVSVLIAKEDADKAVQVIHDAFII